MAVIESRPGDYTSGAIQAAKSVLKTKGLDESAARSIAREILTKRMVEYLNNFDVVNDTLRLPLSQLLNEEEVKLLFQNVFAQWKSERDDMIPDSWKYVIAAGFG